MKDEEMVVAGWCEACGGPVISHGAAMDENGCWTCAACMERFAEDEATE